MADRAALEAPSIVIRASARHGVGVFALREFQRGERLPLFARGDWRAVSEVTLAQVRYAHPTPWGYYVPRSWHRPSPGWYLNHSGRPNVDAKTHRALRRIRRGTEVTIDYRALPEVPSWWVPWLNNQGWR